MREPLVQWCLHMLLVKFHIGFGSAAEEYQSYALPDQQSHGTMLHAR